jgi:hypothetical protein
MAALVAEWAAEYRERHDVPADEPFVIPSWRRLPDFMDDLVLGVMPDPSVAGFRFYPDSRVEVVRRGDVIVP